MAEKRSNADNEGRGAFGPKPDGWQTPYRLIICAFSSIRLFSPITIGPASAIIWARGCTTVPAPTTKKDMRSVSTRLITDGASLTQSDFSLQHGFGTHNASGSELQSRKKKRIYKKKLGEFFRP